MNKEQAMFHWTQNVCLNASFKGRYSGSAWWHRGNVLFRHDKPEARIEKTIDGRFICLENPEFWGYPEDPTIHTPDPKLPEWMRNKMLTIRLDNIGVFSAAPGNMIEFGGELHQFVYRSFRASLEGHLECARTCPVTSLVHYGQSDPLNFRSSYINNDCDRWDQYRAYFCPDMEPLPDISFEVGMIAKERWAKYTSPKAHAKRERAIARRKAKQALGLLDD